MKAMIFAAGLGTRLRPLTDRMPKALVPVGGRPLIDIVSERLRSAGFNELVVNVHHFADQIEAWAEGKPDVKLSDEREQLLETGGGVRHALPLLRPSERFLIHNVDILSDCPLASFWQAGEGAEATLLVSERKTQRYLLFDDEMCLVGWTNTATGEVRTPYEGLDVARCRRLAFAGIHQLSLSLAEEMAGWPERFGIIDFYLAKCSTHRIKGYVPEALRLMDVGKLAELSEAEAFLSTL